jgi:dienelactone hydrolase
MVAVVLVMLASISGCAHRSAQQVPGPPISAASAGSAIPMPVSAPAAAVGLGRAGSYQTGKWQVTFTEPAQAGLTGHSLSPRTLVTQIWSPRADGLAGPFPLLLFAPGFLQCSGAYSGLVQAWASAGYVVAAVNFPLTSCHLGAGVNEADVAHQPRDMSYVLTRLLAMSAAPDDPFSGMLNPHQVGAAGQSDGGDTVTALAANTCCADNRLKAVAVLSGAEWPAMPGRYFPAQAPPMLFTQGSADAINPPWMSLQPYRADGGPRYYLEIFGASHLTPYEGTNPAERLVARVTLAFFDRYILGQADALETMTRDGKASDMAQLVRDGQLPQ